MQLTNLEEKVLKYLKDHVTPVMAKTLAKRFIVSESAISKAMKTLVENDVASVTKSGTQKFYSLKVRGE